PSTTWRRPRRSRTAPRRPTTTAGAAAVLCARGRRAPVRARRRAAVPRHRCAGRRSSFVLAPLAARDAVVQERAQPPQRALDAVLAHAERLRRRRARALLAVGRVEQRAAALGQLGETFAQRREVAVAGPVGTARVPHAVRRLDLARAGAPPPA